MFLHADGFDHYGNDGSANTASMMLADGYQAVSNLFVVGTQTVSGKVIAPRTGNGMLNFNRLDRCYWRRGINSAVQQFQHFPLYFYAAPAADTFGYSFQNGATANIATVAFNPDLSVTIIVGNNTNNFQTTNVVARLRDAIKIGTWSAWEIVYQPDTHGSAPYNGFIAVYLEGILKLAATGLNIAAPVFHQFGGTAIVGGSANCFADDLIIGDASGTTNNTPFGPRRVGTRVATGVGAENDWVVVGANAAAATANIPANTAQFIEGDDVGDITSLTLPASNLLISGVAGVILKAYAQKTSAGASQFKLGIRSGATVVNSPDITPGVGFAYWNSGFFEADPNTGQAFTRAAYDALQMRATRSA